MGLGFRSGNSFSYDNAFNGKSQAFFGNPCGRHGIGGYSSAEGGDNADKFDTDMVGEYAKVQGDRKALPVKALCREKHLAVSRAETRG